jgi:hypothetical protein
VYGGVEEPIFVLNNGSIWQLHALNSLLWWKQLPVPTMESRVISCPFQKWNSDSSVIKFNCYTDGTIPVPMSKSVPNGKYALQCQLRMLWHKALIHTRPASSLFMNEGRGGRSRRIVVQLHYSLDVVLSLQLSDSLCFYGVTPPTWWELTSWLRSARIWICKQSI